MNIPPPFVPPPRFEPDPLPAPSLPGYTADPALQDAIPNDVVVRMYRQLRDKVEEITKRQKSELTPFTDAMNQLEVFMLDRLNRTGSESVRTPDGTAFKVTQTRYTVKDPGALRPWIEAQGAADLLETRVSKTALTEWLKAGNPLPPGIDVSQYVQVQFRKS